MRVTAFLNPYSAGPERDLDNIEFTIQQAVEADAAGFASVLLTEHHFSGVNGYGDPYLMAARLAGEVNRAYLGIAVATVPYHHPLRLVEYANLLDNLTAGRLLFGLGAGGVSAAEWDGFGLDREQRREITEQRIDAMLRAWGHTPGGDPVDVGTDWDKGVLTGRLMPASYRRPHPLLARATASDVTIRQTGRRGWPVLFGLVPTPAQIALYREGLELGGHDEATCQRCWDWVAHTKYVVVGDTDKEAWELARPAAEALAARHGHLTKRVGEDSRETNIFASAEDLIARSMIIGSPETVRDGFLQAREDTGLNHVRTWFKFGQISRELAERSFRLFADEVLPALEPEQFPADAEDPRTSSLAASL